MNTVSVGAASQALLEEVEKMRLQRAGNIRAHMGKGILNKFSIRLLISLNEFFS